ncbi:hypothetical protein QYF61_009864 [Mycteria americana]|uniref:Uncharacterized protein n=1 Tax=Mycteria americana TaxID=33587 RepID=A0AAN7RTL6_MYCAM|nr:hypothetical protein QYF61_009864 [Mycteria americana]
MQQCRQKTQLKCWTGPEQATDISLGHSAHHDGHFLLPPQARTQLLSPVIESSKEWELFYGQGERLRNPANHVLAIPEWICFQCSVGGVSGSAFDLRLQCISGPKSLLSHEVTGTVENGKCRGGEYLEFSKIFDSLSCSSFMTKLEMNGFRAITVRQGSYSEELDRLEKWADWNLMKAKKSKGEVLHLEEEPAHAGMQAVDWLPRKQVHRKGCWVLGDTQLNMRQQCAFAANRTNHCHPEPSRPTKATKSIRGLTNMTCEERLREVGLPILEKTCLKGDLLLSTTTFSEETEKMDLISGSAQKVEHGEF